jgi:hypothetical protein
MTLSFNMTGVAFPLVFTIIRDVLPPSTEDRRSRRHTRTFCPGSVTQVINMVPLFIYDALPYQPFQSPLRQSGTATPHNLQVGAIENA